MYVIAGSGVPQPGCRPNIAWLARRTDHSLPLAEWKLSCAAGSLT
jgi:hypothetical protein